MPFYLKQILYPQLLKTKKWKNHLAIPAYRFNRFTLLKKEHGYLPHQGFFFFKKTLNFPLFKYVPNFSFDSVSFNLRKLSDKLVRYWIAHLKATDAYIQFWKKRMVIKNASLEITVLPARRNTRELCACMHRHACWWQGNEHIQH